MYKMLWLLPALLLAGCAASKRLALNPPAPITSDTELLRVFTESRTPPGDELHTERYLDAQQHAATMPAANLGGWATLGPSMIGGRTRSLLIHPTNPNIMYAGAVSGGVWKTTDAGNSWIPLTDNQVLPFICTLAMDPANPNIIYAGTGESFGVSYQGIRGLGILKTTDAGNTWTRLSTTSTSDFYFVNKIRISPINSQHVYAATSTGVFRSLDGGATWTQSMPAPPAGLSATVPGCQDLAIPTGTPTDTVFAACVRGFSLPGGIWRNTDAAGAGTWTSVQSFTGVIRIGLALAPSAQSTIYAITAVGNNGANSYINALGSVVRSTSNGDPGTWITRTSNADPTLLNTLLLNYPNYSCGGPSADSQKVGQGAYDMAIEVDPVNPNTVWVAGIDVFRSNDGGANWGIASFWDIAGTGSMHADQHQIVFPPQWNGTSNQTLYVVNDAGIWRTTNANAPVVTGTNALCTVFSNGTSSYTGAAITWTPLNSGYVTTQFYQGSVYTGGGAYIGGTQDNGTLRGDPVQGPSSWTLVQGGDGAVWRVDPVDSSVFYGEGASLSLTRFTFGGRFYQSIINGINDDTAIITPYVLDPNDSRRLYLGGGTRVWRSDNQGDTWTPIGPGNAVYINALAVAPSDSTHIVAGDQNGNLFSTSTALSSPTWASSRPRVGVVSAIAFHPSDPNIVFAAYSTFDAATGDNHMYKSVDAGRSWTGIDGAGSNGLPDLPVSSMVLDPLNPSTIYLGTDLGIFVSADAGNTWSHDDSSFSNTIINSLALDRGAGVTNLYAFTFGRGVWRTTLAGPGAPCTYSVSPTAVTADAFGSTGFVQITTGPGCAWSAQVDSGYVQLLPPASGIGSGRVYYRADPNEFSSARDPGIFSVQGTQVHVTSQPGADFTTSNDTVATAQHIPALPYISATFQTFTSDPSDPVHTCTGSRDLQTAWWTFTAPSDGMVNFNARSARLDGTPGDGGFVVTAYPAASINRESELGCFTRPRTTGTFSPYTGFSFAVKAGTSYVLETSATTTGPTGVYFMLSYAAAPGSMKIVPSTANLAVNGRQHFTALATNLLTPVVRWSISPQTGSIDENGFYTAPISLTAPTNVQVKAVSVADNVTQATATVALNTVPVAIGAVTNAASFLVDAVSPGEMVTLFGNGLGPATLVQAQLTPSGTVSTLVSQTQVLFDNTPAPIIYVQAGQTTVMVPYEVAGQTSTQVVAVYQGQRSAPLTVPVAPSAPGVFTQDGKQGAILNFNPDATVTLNTTTTRAPAGSIIEVYATGEGQTTPPGVDGVLNTSPILPAPLLHVSVTIAGKPAQVMYAGAAPGGVAGFLQLNVVIPPGLSPGAQPLVVTIGQNMTPAVVTVWIK